MNAIFSLFLHFHPFIDGNSRGKTSLVQLWFLEEDYLYPLGRAVLCLHLPYEEYNGSMTVLLSLSLFDRKQNITQPPTFIQLFTNNLALKCLTLTLPSLTYH